VNFYINLFKEAFGTQYGGSRILHTRYFGEKELKALGDYASAKPGGVWVIRFQLNGLQFMAVNGGDFFSFTEGISLYVGCDTQEQIDCGWVKDKWDISWQIAPHIMREMVEDTDVKKSENVMPAIYRMHKIDIAILKGAYQEN
jgi:predicted 3-demethylubiquinone-9 3-methyltransferase (glyoxalase superfamily)